MTRIDDAVERYRNILLGEKQNLQQRLLGIATSQRYVTTQRIFSESYKTMHYLQAAGLEDMVYEWVEEVLEPLSENAWKNKLAPWRRRQ